MHVVMRGDKGPDDQNGVFGGSTAGMTSFGCAVLEGLVAEGQGLPGVLSRMPGGYSAALRLHSLLSLCLA